MSDIVQRRVKDDHKTWRDDHAAWIGDISRWQTEHQEAMFALERFEAMLRAHSDAVRTHAHAVEWHETRLSEQNGIDAHHELASRHAVQRELHNRIKVRHSGMMDQLRLLLRIIPEPPRPANEQPDASADQSI